MGNLLDHPPFILVYVVSFGMALSLFLGTSLAPGSVAGTWTRLWDNAILLTLMALVFFVGGVVGLAGNVGLWRFRDWGRQFVMIGAIAYALVGLLTLIAGGMNRGGGEGAHVASTVLWGVLMMAMGGAVAFYMTTDEVRSRMQQ